MVGKTQSFRLVLLWATFFIVCITATGEERSKVTVSELRGAMTRLAAELQVLDRAGDCSSFLRRFDNEHESNDPVSKLGARAVLELNSRFPKCRRVLFPRIETTAIEEYARSGNYLDDPQLAAAMARWADVALSEILGATWRERLANAGLPLAAFELSLLHLRCGVATGSTGAFWSWLASPEELPSTFKDVEVFSIDDRSKCPPLGAEASSLEEACYWSGIQALLRTRHSEPIAPASLAAFNAFSRLALTSPNMREDWRLYLAAKPQLRASRLASLSWRVIQRIEEGCHTQLPAAALKRVQTRLLVFDLPK